MGLFIGVELIADADKSPATQLAQFVINRMAARRILIGAEGPADNILKIRPPMTITVADARQILTVFEDSLIEGAYCPLSKE